MKVLDLQCPHAHSFEGWFASEDDFQDQLARGLLTCPMCAAPDVRKKLSAPRLNLSTSRSEPASAAAGAAATPVDTEQATQRGEPDLQQLHAAWLKLTRQVLASTEDVGAQFSEEARKMHYGEAERRNIRGQASVEETKALLEEGIAVMPLPLADAVKDTLQ